MKPFGLNERGGGSGQLRGWHVGCSEALGHLYQLLLSEVGPDVFVTFFFGGGGGLVLYYSVIFFHVYFVVFWQGVFNVFRVVLPTLGTDGYNEKKHVLFMRLSPSAWR